METTLIAQISDLRAPSALSSLENIVPTHAPQACSRWLWRDFS
jgi:hypothetical protein